MGLYGVMFVNLACVYSWASVSEGDKRHAFITTDVHHFEADSTIGNQQVRTCNGIAH